MFVYFLGRTRGCAFIYIVIRVLYSHTQRLKANLLQITTTATIMDYSYPPRSSRESPFSSPTKQASPRRTPREKSTPRANHGSSSPYYNGVTTDQSPNRNLFTSSNQDISLMRSSSTAHFRHLSNTANGSGQDPNLYIPGVSDSTEDVQGTLISYHTWVITNVSRSTWTSTTATTWIYCKSNCIKKLDGQTAQKHPSLRISMSYRWSQRVSYAFFLPLLGPEPIGLMICFFFFFCQKKKQKALFSSAEGQWLTTTCLLSKAAFPTVFREVPRKTMNSKIIPLLRNGQ